MATFGARGSNSLARVGRYTYLDSTARACAFPIICIQKTSNYGGSSQAMQGQFRWMSTGSTADISKYKRGRGGRSSFSGIVATVFGATGFTGPYVTHRLATIGSQVIVMYREDPGMVRKHRVMGDLGQIIPLPWNINDEDSIRRAIKYSNVVINLVGRDQETWNYSFDDIHVKWPRRLGRMCKEMGVDTLLHVSALNASPMPPTILMPGGSRFLKTKYEGELAIRSEFPETIIFRPSDIFGTMEDRFIQYYGSIWRQFLPVMTAIVEVYAKGEKTVKQPVFLGDFCRGVISAVQQSKRFKGQTFDIVGPYRYNLSELIDFFAGATRRDVDEYERNPMTKYRRIDITPLIKARAWLSDKCPYLPWKFFRIIYKEKIEREGLTDIPTPALPGLADLGVENLTELERRALYELRYVRDVGYGAPEDSGILDPLDMTGKYPKRLPPVSIEPI